ncbi:MAG: hypothetical protein K5707_00635 [Clostridia bacterium]|nr:hypothetical protein [Clostridia bacterium]
MDARLDARKLAYRRGHIEADIYGECRGSERPQVRELTAWLRAMRWKTLIE